MLWRYHHQMRNYQHLSVCACVNIIFRWPNIIFTLSLSLSRFKFYVQTLIQLFRAYVKCLHYNDVTWCVSDFIKALSKWNEWEGNLHAYELSSTGKCQHLKFRNKSRKSFSMEGKFCRLLNRINHTLSPRIILFNPSTHIHAFLCHNFPQVISVDYEKSEREGFKVIYIYILRKFFCTFRCQWNIFLCVA